MIMVHRHVHSHIPNSLVQEEGCLLHTICEYVDVLRALVIMWTLIQTEVEKDVQLTQAESDEEGMCKD